MFLFIKLLFSWIINIQNILIEKKCRMHSLLDLDNSTRGINRSLILNVITNVFQTSLQWKIIINHGIVNSPWGQNSRSKTRHSFFQDRKSWLFNVISPSHTHYNKWWHTLVFSSSPSFVVIIVCMFDCCFESKSSSSFCF